METKEIKQKITCPWCGAMAYQSGPQYIGSGINSLTYSCYICKAITISSRHEDMEIESVKLEYQLKNP